MSMHMCVDVYVDACADTCIDMRIDSSIRRSREVPLWGGAEWCGDAHDCKACSRAMDGSDGWTGAHMYRHVHTHACSHVRRCVHRHVHEHGDAHYSRCVQSISIEQGRNYYRPES